MYNSLQDLLRAPFSTAKTIHFVGIGGIGMSGIAEIFHNLGFIIQGSDTKETDITNRLKNIGITIFPSHSSENIVNADIVVISSAIKESNPEYKGALDIGKPVFKRANFLAELMRFKWSIAIAGTHGKTTTSSLMAHIMQFNHLTPTSVIGGIVNSWGYNSVLGEGNWLVAECDESDGSFLDLPATIAVITNIESEHLDHYKDYDDIKEHFIRFVNGIPFYGFAVVCIDSPGVQDILPFIKQRKIITYGQSPQSDYRITNIKHFPNGMRFNIVCQIPGKNKNINDIYLPIYGIHNVMNATATLVVADNIGLNDTNVNIESLSSFQGVKRRFSNIGAIKDTEFIDDYAHHPSEIQAVVDAALHLKEEEKKIISVFQPHRYSRLNSNFDGFSKSFNDSDYVLVLDVYPAGEAPIEGISSFELVEAIKKHGHKNVFYIKDTQEIISKISSLINEDNISMVLFMGAGDITNIAKDVLEEIKKIK